MAAFNRAARSEELAATLNGADTLEAAGAIEAAPIPGLGDAALFLSGSWCEDEAQCHGALLLVQTDTDMWYFGMDDPPPNAQDMLTALAHAVLVWAAHSG